MSGAPWLVAYGLTIVWLTWPLALHVGSELPSPWIGAQINPLLIAWALSWQSQALLDDPANFATANIYHPDPGSLLFGEAGFGALPYFLPVFAVTGNPILAANITFLGCTLLTALSIHWVAWRWTASTTSAALAATMYLTTRWVLWVGAPCAINYAVLQYFPLIIFFAAERSRPLRTEVLLVALVVLQGQTGLYAAAAVLAPLGVLAISRSLRGRTRADGLRLLTACAASSFVLLIFYAGYVVTWLRNPDILGQGAWSRFTWQTMLPWGPFSYWAPTGVPIVAFILVGCSALALIRAPRTAALSHAWSQGAFWVVLFHYSRRIVE